MKVLRTNHHGAKTIYITRSDIAQLTNSDASIPAKVYRQISNQTKIANYGMDNHGYIQFEGEEIVAYLNSLDYIIDADEYNRLNPTQIEKRFNEVNYELEKRQRQFEEQGSWRNAALIDTINNMAYKLNQIEIAYYTISSNQLISVPPVVYKSTDKKDSKKLVLAPSRA